MPTARPMMPSSERLVSNTRAAPYFSCSPSVAPCTPPFGPTSSPNTSMRWIERELHIERAPDGGQHVDARGFRLRHRAYRGNAHPFRPQTALLLHCAVLEEHVARQLASDPAAGVPVRAPRRARTSLRACLRDLRPLRRRHASRAPERRADAQRIARALLAQGLRGFVGLRVLAGVSGEARHRQAQQQRRARRAHARHGVPCQLRRLLRIAAVAFEDGEAGEGRAGSRRCCRRGSAGARAPRCRRRCPRCRRASAAAAWWRC